MSMTKTGGGFAAGAQAGAGSATQGLSPATVQGLKDLGVDVVGPETALSPQEAGIMRPESMGGKGPGGAERATKAATPKAKPPPPGEASQGKPIVNPEPSAIQSLAEIIAAMTGGMPELQSMQEGGELDPGQSAIVGEAGPEMIQARPTGGTAVMPLLAAQPPEKSKTRQVFEKLGDIALGAAMGQAGSARVLAARADQASQMAQLGIMHPGLLRASPALVQAVDSQYGAGTAQKLVSESDPNVQARMLSQLYGIPPSPSGNDFQQLTDVMAERGWGVTTTSKGEIRFNRQARPTAQQDEIQAFGDFQKRRDILMKRGLGEVQASQQAAKDVLTLSASRGYTVPDTLQNLAMAEPEIALAASKAAAQEAATRQIRLSIPIDPNEIRAQASRIAKQYGGVVYGSDLSDNDLISAEERGFTMKQQADGTYVGIPKQLIANDPKVVEPSTLLTRRVALKMATQTTNQTENAKTVIAYIDAVDEKNSLRFLVPSEVPATGTLTEKVYGKAKTVLKARTIGRLTLWQALDSPDPEVRDAAVALDNLRTATTAFVKATGDVGAITESDRKIIDERFGGIARAEMSQQQAQGHLIRIRAIMNLIRSKGQITKGSPKAEETKAQIHDLLTSATLPDPNAPPPGFSVAPNTNIFWSIAPDEEQ